MTAHQMPARYAGRCPRGCGRHIRRGELITRYRSRTYCPACWAERQP